MVRVEGSVFRRDEGLRQRIEGLGGTEPGELFVQVGNRGLEVALEGTPYQGVHAVGGDDDVALRDIVDEPQVCVELQLDPGVARPLLNEKQKIKSPDR